LHPKNVLLDEEGHILLTYFGSWEETEHIPDEEAMNHFYCAPGNNLVNLKNNVHLMLGFAHVIIVPYYYF